MLGEPQRDRCCLAPGGDSGVLDGRSVSGEEGCAKGQAGYIVSVRILDVSFPSLVFFESISTQGDLSW